jgi:hypothetical protein|uniref:Uncharacterized protein n=1 Tax=Oryza rufipogon TaxID=4529 RepID=A0A0E0QP24_ORYRU
MAAVVSNVITGVGRRLVLLVLTLLVLAALDEAPPTIMASAARVLLQQYAPTYGPPSCSPPYCAPRHARR